MKDDGFNDYEPNKVNLPTETGQQMVNPFAMFRQLNSTGSGVLFHGDTIKCSHINGEWTRSHGETSTLIGIEERLIVNPPEMIDTWTKYWGGKQVDGGRRVYRTSNFEFAPPREALGDLDQERWEWERGGRRRKDPWQRTVLLPMKAMSDNEVVVFRATGQSAINEIAEICDMYGSADRGGRLPVIEPRSRSFESSHGSLIHVPVFELVDWAFWEANIPAPPVPLRPISAVALPAPPPTPAAPAAKPAASDAKRRNDDMDDDIPF